MEAIEGEESQPAVVATTTSGGSDRSCRPLTRGAGDGECKMSDRSSHCSQSIYSRKVPATTARRRGTYVPKTRTSEPISGELNRTNENVIESAAPTFVLSDADLANIELLNVDLASNESEDVLGSDAVSGSDIEMDDYFDRIYDNGELFSDDSFGRIKLKVWMIFMDKETFLNVLRDYCVQEGFSVVVVKADQLRYTAVCGQSECKWRIHASRLIDGVTWAVKSLYDDHSCLKLTKFNSMATPEWAAKKLLDHVRADEEVTGRTMQTLLMNKYGINMKPTSLYKERSLALVIINGKHDTSYGSLPGYCEVVKSSNVGSIAHIIWTQSRDEPERPLQFKSVFISMNPMIDGAIHGCRGLIGVDGCHLKGKYGGIILSAIVVDGNNEIFPLAYGVYENECKNTWSSFFYQMREVLRSSNRTNWCIISYRQKGIEPALADVWPSVGRRYCCTHLCADFKKAFPGLPVQEVFWSFCKAFSEHKFRKAMEKVELVAGKGAQKWLQCLGEFEYWARYKYELTLHSPQTSSNFVESFNATLGADRCLPVLSLLEGIRRTTMVRHCNRQEAAGCLPTDGITDFAKKKLEAAVIASRSLQVFKVSPTEYEVMEDRSALAVNIRDFTCGCGEWQIRGIPCRHAVRAIIESRGHPEHFVFEWYSIRMYKQTYSANYRSVPNEEQWPAFDLPKIEPPTMKRRVGRPSKTRRRQEGQAPAGKRSRLVRCGRCQAYGHNVKTCKGGPTAKELRVQQGIQVERRTRKKVKQASRDEQAQSMGEVMSSAPWMAETQ